MSCITIYVQVYYLSLFFCPALSYSALTRYVCRFISFRFCCQPTHISMLGKNNDSISTSGHQGGKVKKKDLI